MENWITEAHSDAVHFNVKVKEQLYHGQSKYQMIDIYDTYAFGRLLALDGDIMITEKDEFIYHDMIVHVPMATNPDIKKVLVIGGGDGGTVRELTRYKTIEQIDMVELDEQVVNVCRDYFKDVASGFDDPRVHLYFEDGVSFVSGLKEVYDLIIVDSTDPFGPGEGLFSKGFYENCFYALKEDGILINQHESPYYENDAYEMKRSHANIKRTFDIAKVYQFHMPTYPSGHWLFGFASKTMDPETVDLSTWEALDIKTKYYNTKIHKGAFALPTYVVNMLEEV
ncbi:MAG: polyamine aminopropyltransferase [Clostridia bacterium]|nr:polyamine aminopropyltransferase [Clostridia bacterium]